MHYIRLNTFYFSYWACNDCCPYIHRSYSRVTFVNLICIYYGYDFVYPGLFTWLILPAVTESDFQAFTGWPVAVTLSYPQR